MEDLNKNRSEFILLVPDLPSVAKGLIFMGGYVTQWENG